MHAHYPAAADAFLSDKGEMEQEADCTATWLHPARQEQGHIAQC